MDTKIEQRIKELEELSYQKISVLANSLGVIKPEEQKWQDPKTLKAIALAEQGKGKSTKANYKKGLILYCGVCDRPLKTNPQGIATCH